MSEERKSGKEDAFRDIHDVFMCEYVDERCKVKNAEKCFFVTYNIGLIKMGNNWMKHNEQLLIHPGKVVVELWMHDVNFTNSRMKNSALTESIARCLTLNNKDVLRKLEVVSHYYNQDSPDFDVKTYQEIYKSLVRRSQGVVDYVDEILENEQTDKKELNQELMKNLLAEVKEQTALCEAVTSKFRKESEATTTLLQQEVDILKQSVHTQGKTIHSFKQKNEDQETKIMRLINESANLKDENKKLQAENNLRKREALLGSQIKKLQLENGYLNSKRNKSVSYFYYYFTYILMLLALSTILAFGILHLLNLNVVILSWLTGGGAVILVGWVFCIWKNEPDVFMCKVFKEKIYQKQVEVWDRKHPEYKENCDELETLSSELNEIRSKLNNL